MTPEKQNFNPDEMKKVMHAMRINMRNNALRHFSHVDIRTLRILETLNLFKDKPISMGEDMDIALLEDIQHPRRITSSVGPLILYYNEDKTKKTMVDLMTLLFSDSLSIREAALKCMDGTGNTRLAITPKTKGIIENTREALLSNVPEEWKVAAVTISDAMNDDILIILQGVRQCLECKPDKDTLDSYISKLLRPSVSSIESITLSIRDPENEHDQMTKIIEQIVKDANTLTEVCSNYYERLGFLPLAPQYGMAEAVQRWSSTHPDANVWKEVWNWSRNSFGPIPRYHACCVFALHPEYIPQGKFSNLWNEILKILNPPNIKNTNEFRKEEWIFRRDLVRHFVFHFEACLPDSNSANIACFAWWFSEQVASLFPDKPQTIRFYRKNWVNPALEISSRVWLLASSPVQESFLRNMTFSAISPWASSLLSTLSFKMEYLRFDEQAAKVQSRLLDALTSQLISNSFFSSSNSVDPTFAIELSLVNLALKAQKYQPEDIRNSLDQLMELNNKLGNNKEICDTLRNFDEVPFSFQLAVALALKSKSYSDPTIAQSLWDIIDNMDWRLKIFKNIDARIQTLLMESFLILQVQNRDKWFSFFPHFIGDLCENADNEDQRHRFFLFLVHACLASETTSALRRLLRGDHKEHFLKLVNEYQEQLENIRKYLPPWVAGKLRDLIANLRVA